MNQQLSIKQYMGGQGVQNKLNELLGDRKDVFLTSALQAVNDNNLLKNATPESVFGAVVTAAILNLPLNNNLGFAYLVPYSRSMKDARGNWQKVQEASFQMGYKGFIQLAQRSGQFKRINACKIYDGDTEQSVYERLTSLLPKQPPSQKVEGYIAYFQLLNGFEAHLSMTVAELESHAKQFSQTYKNGRGVWKDNFDAMAQKTVIKLLLSKQAPLSIVPTLAQAVEADQATIKDVNGEMQYDYVDNQPEQPPVLMDLSNDAALFATVKSQVEAGQLDKVAVVSGKLGYLLSDEQKGELAPL